MDKNNPSTSKLNNNPLLSGVTGGGDFSKRLNDQMSGPTGPCIGCDEEDNTPVVNNTGLSASEEKMLANYRKLGGDPRAFKQAMCFYNANKNKRFATTGEGYNSGIRMDNQRYITINDMTKPSSQKRLFIIDRQTGEVTAYQSSHGRGRGNKTNTHETSKNFSNSGGSNLSPSGFFITGNRYVSNKLWKHGMRLHGLQIGINDNSMARGIVLHPGRNRSGPYTTGGEAKSSDSRPKLKGAPAGRTEGCTAVDPNFWKSIMDRTQAGIEGRRPYKGGSLYYNYSSSEKSRGDNYCGHNLVRTK